MGAPASTSASAASATSVASVASDAIPGDTPPVVGARKPLTTRSWVIAGASAAALIAWTVTLIASSTRASLWGDEAFVPAMVRQPWNQLIRALGHIDVNMSAYYLVAKAWTAAFGDSDAGLRSLSVVLIAASFPVLWVTLARVYDATTATIGVALAATNPFVITIALTARSYAMLWLLCALSLLLLDRALEASATLRWIAWALVGVVMLYAHLLAVLVLAGEVGFALIRLRRLDRAFLAGCGLLALGAIPTVAFLAPANTLAWIPPFSLHQAVDSARTALGGRVVGVVIAGLAVAGTALVLQRHDTTRRRGLFAVVAATYVAALFVLIPIQTLFVELYFTPVTLLAIGLSAVALGAIRRANWRAVCAGVVIACSTVVVITTTLPNPAVIRQDWRGATATLAREVQPGDAIAFPNSFYRPAIEHYAPATPRVLAATPTLPNGAWGTVSAYELDRLNRVDANVTPARVQAAAEGSARVWLVAPTDDGQAARAQQLFIDRGWRVERSIGRNGITLTALTRTVG